MPLSISIPPFSDGVPVAFEFIRSMLSAIVTVSDSTVVVVPETVRFPSILSVPLPDLIMASEAPLSSINVSPLRNNLSPKFDLLCHYIVPKKY